MYSNVNKSHQMENEKACKFTGFISGSPVNGDRFGDFKIVAFIIHRPVPSFELLFNKIASYEYYPRASA